MLTEPFSLLLGTETAYSGVLLLLDFLRLHCAVIFIFSAGMVVGIAGFQPAKI